VLNIRLSCPLPGIEHRLLYCPAFGLVAILPELSWLIMYTLKLPLVFNDGMGSYRCSAHGRGGYEEKLHIVINIR
jgi:hypothetical protein